MAKLEPEEVLNSIPKRAPVWAIGITTVVVGLTSCFVTLYFVAKDDIRQRLTWSQELASAESKDENIKEAKALDSVLTIINTNMVQLAELNKALGLAQVQASNLAIRVTDLENAVNRLKGSLSSCEESLKKCIDKK